MHYTHTHTHMHTHMCMLTMPAMYAGPWAPCLAWSYPHVHCYSRSGRGSYWPRRARCHRSRATRRVRARRTSAYEAGHPSRWAGHTGSTARRCAGPEHGPWRTGPDTACRCAPACPPVPPELVRARSGLPVVRAGLGSGLLPTVAAQPPIRWRAPARLVPARLLPAPAGHQDSLTSSGRPCAPWRYGRRRCDPRSRSGPLHSWTCPCAAALGMPCACSGRRNPCGHPLH